MQGPWRLKKDWRKPTLKSLGPEQVLLDLLLNVFTDLCARYPSHRKSFCRDMTVIRSRYECEGYQFLTKALPKLGKAIDRALVEGQLSSFSGFKARKGRRYPAFMQGLFSQLFDDEGILVDECPVSVISDIRQVLYLAYKAEFPYHPDDVQRVIDAFIQTDRELTPPTPSPLLTLARKVVRDVITQFDPREILPRHGPGAVATGETGDRKWRFKRLYHQLDWWYPYLEYFQVGGEEDDALDRHAWRSGLVREENPPEARVVLVPKDSRGPRLISMEPLEIQWIQQGIMRALVPFLEAHQLTAGRLNFLDQSVNRDLAKSSSLNQVYSTIDLKDASDRVSLELVRYLFPKRLVPYLEATRSQSTKLPNGESIPLNKFAPMGSAVCFPIEALVFWALSLAALSLRTGIPFQHCADLVYVYGDDIIVPTHYVEEVMSALESVGLMVNREKCCTAGFFRESCGMDAYKGVNVTPVKISTLWSVDPRSGSCLASYTSYANELAERGFDAAASYIWSIIAEQFGVIPRACSGFGAPHRCVDNLQDAVRLNEKAQLPQRFNRSIQQYQVRARVVKTLSYASKLDGWSRLLRDMCLPGYLDNDRVVRRGRTQLCYRWVTLGHPQ